METSNDYKQDKISEQIQLDLSPQLKQQTSSFLRQNPFSPLLSSSLFLHERVSDKTLVAFSSYFSRSILYNSSQSSHSALTPSQPIPQLSSNRVPYLRHDIFDETISTPDNTYPSWIPMEQEFLSKLEELRTNISYILFRIAQQVQLTTSEFQLFLIYLNRICFDDGVHSFIDATWDNQAMLIVTGLLLACKILNDQSLKNSFWSYLFNVPLAQVNESERCMLGVLKWNLQVSEREWEMSSRIIQRLVAVDESCWNDGTDME